MTGTREHGLFKMQCNAPWKELFKCTDTDSGKASQRSMLMFSLSAALPLRGTQHNSESWETDHLFHWYADTL